MFSLFLLLIFLVMLEATDPPPAQIGWYPPYCGAEYVECETARAYSYKEGFFLVRRRDGTVIFVTPKSLQYTSPDGKVHVCIPKDRSPRNICLMGPGLKNTP